MSDRSENFNAAGEDPEATLVAPRFDADDARRAHPVVPLAEAPPRASYIRARAPRRSWTPALLAVALLAVAAVGGAVATKVMQSPSAEQVQEQEQPAPSQAAEAPPPASPTAAEAPREDVPAAKPATRDTRPRRARAAAPADFAPDDDYEDEDRRGKHAEKRRERDDDVEKEMRKALKRAKGKAPRLVDVLSNP